MLVASMPLAALATRSSSVSLKGGAASPDQAIEIKGDGLYEGTYYGVTCILNMKSKKDKYSHVQVYTSSSLPVTVNMHPVSNSGQSIIATNEDNYLVIEAFRNFESAQIRNIDRDNTLTVSNCVATPSIN
tara:strand:+ start:2366 stop:2755 length:390 start_codon:yes stop_codon:yes gene_type:complete